MTRCVTSNALFAVAVSNPPRVPNTAPAAPGAAKAPRRSAAAVASPSSPTQRAPAHRIASTSVSAISVSPADSVQRACPPLASSVSARSRMPWSPVAGGGGRTGPDEPPPPPQAASVSAASTAAVPRVKRFIVGRLPVRLKTRRPAPAP